MYLCVKYFNDNEVKNKKLYTIQQVHNFAVQ